MKLCKRCVNPDTRPNIVFDEEGVCLVCRYEEAKRSAQINWAERDAELAEIIEWGKRNTKSSYDCIVTVSGGKDSMRQAFHARDVLGLNVLLVSCVYPPEQIHARGPANLANLISHGFDAITVSLNPQVWKDLMRISFFRYSNWCRSAEMALYSIPIHVAIAQKTPLIFLGENPALTIGEKHGNLDGDASQMKYCNTLGGGDPSMFLGDGVTRKDLHFYAYPPERDVENADLRIIYLGYYIRDWSGSNNAKLAIEKGLKTRHDTPENTGDLWGFTGVDEDFRLVNQMIKYVKFGLGHVNDQVCEAISSGRMTREEGIEIVKKYDGKCSEKYISKFCRYLGMSEKEFWDVVEAARGLDVWTKGESGEWRLRCDELD